MQVTAIKIHTSEQVREIIEEALAIADSFGVSSDRHEAIFDKAADLLGARATIAAQPVPLDLGKLGLGAGAGGH